MAWVEQLNSQALRPDLTLFLQVSPKVASRRRHARGADAELFEADERQARIARQYLSAIRRRAGKERIVRIDGERSPDEVTALALEELRRALGLGR